MGASSNMAAGKSWRPMLLRVSTTCCKPAWRRYTYDNLSIHLAYDTLPALALPARLHPLDAHTHVAPDSRSDRAGILQYPGCEHSPQRAALGIDCAADRHGPGARHDYALWRVSR